MQETIDKKTSTLTWLPDDIAYEFALKPLAKKETLIMEESELDEDGNHLECRVNYELPTSRLNPGGPRQLVIKTTQIRTGNDGIGEFALLEYVEREQNQNQEEIVVAAHMLMMINDQGTPRGYVISADYMGSHHIQIQTNRRYPEETNIVTEPDLPWFEITKENIRNTVFPGNRENPSRNPLEVRMANLYEKYAFTIEPNAKEHVTIR